MKRVAGVVLLLLLLGAGGWWLDRSKRPVGVVLISIDTLRADHLGAYGYSADTSPFFDAFAERGNLFENAVVQLPGTLPSHMSIFTGLYPGEHGVYPPDNVLSPEIATLPEIFKSAGYRTAGFTEGGYVKGHYGFARGFDIYSDELQKKPGGAGKTFALAKDFIAGLVPGDRFFLFLHTYEVHDPYMSGEPYSSNSWPHERPETWWPSGKNLTLAAEGRLEITSEQLAYFAAMYDANIRYVDDVLRDFMEFLWAEGLSPETTVVITSDHGEEFLEHGSLVHRQVYNETLHVPLLIRRLGQRRGNRIKPLVQSIDIAPTLVEMAGVSTGAQFSGKSLVPSMKDPQVSVRPEAFAEGVVAPTRSLYRSTEEGLFRFGLTRHAPFEDRVAAGKSLTFDGAPPQVRFKAASYHAERTLGVYVNGALIQEHPLRPDAWLDIVIDLFGVWPKYRVDLKVDGCDSPLELGTGTDRRCLGFFVKGITPERRELFRLDRDPEERFDLSPLRLDLALEMEEALGRYRWERRRPVERQELSEEQVEQLKALGYLQ